MQFTENVAQLISRIQQHFSDQIPRTSPATVRGAGARGAVSTTRRREVEVTAQELDRVGRSPVQHNLHKPPGALFFRVCPPSTA